MGFFRERQSRDYFAFICLFLGLLLCFAGALTWLWGREMKTALAGRELAAASYLLEQGTDPGTVAAALGNTQVTQAGQKLLEQVGHTSRTSVWLWPTLGESFRVQLAAACMGALLVWLILGGGTLWFLRGRERLYQEAVAIVDQFAQGNFSAHLPRNQSGTLYQLFSSIDQLAMALQAKSQAEHKSKEFLKNTVSDISHQLKTPLAALNMYTEIILEEPDNPGTILEFAGKSMESLNRMEQLIQMLLKVMRLDAGAISFEKRVCRIADLAERAENQLRTRAQGEGKRILLQGPSQAVILCDFQWTSEALGNLVKNALDHTKEGDSIQIRWESSPAMMRIFVEDNGCGISPEDIHHIFKRFYRSAGARDTQGVGLGLPLAKAVVEGQGGILSVQSTPGRGTRFILSFLTESQAEIHENVRQVC